jgi:hypothetical protein
MRFVAAIDMEVNESKLIFNVRQVTSVLCSLEVVTSSRVLDQSTINVVAALLGFPKVTQHSTESDVVTTFERFVVDLLTQIRVFRENA